MKTKLLCLLFVVCSLCHAAEKREITVELQAPDTTWSLKIQQVVQVEDEIWVISRLSQKEGMMGAMMITTLTDSVSVEAGDQQVKHYVLGKTWNWDNGGEITFLKDLSGIAEKLEEGKGLYPVEKP